MRDDGDTDGPPASRVYSIEIIYFTNPYCIIL